MTARECLRQARLRLEEAHVPDAEIDAAWLLGSVLGMGRLQTLALGDQPLTARQEEAFEALLCRRLTREPLQYILGETDFMGHRFLARPGALIPRNDTELLAGLALSRLRPGGRALDLCTGSGILAVTLALSVPGAQVDAADLSPRALALARDNAALHGANVNFLLGDLFSPCTGTCYDMICCNPPYIKSGDLPLLQEEVRFEPDMALDGGEDGLDFYRRLAGEAPSYLVPGGHMLLETGDGQAEDVAALLTDSFEDIRVYDDMAGLPRVVAARRKEAHALA